MADFALPADLQSITIADERGREYQLVVEAENPGPYESWFITSRDYQENSRLMGVLLASGGTLIDVGANIGTICLPTAKQGARVIAVEVLDRNVEKLRAAARVNGLANFRVVAAAATSVDGPIGVAGTEAWGHVSTAADARQIPGLRLDTVIEQVRTEDPAFLRAPIAIKIDVEGHELDVLMGAERLLSEHRPTLVIESIDPANEPPGASHAVKQFVTDLGYIMFAIGPNRALTPYKLGDLQIGLVCDYLAVPTDRIDIVQDLHPTYQIRDLTIAEKLAWLDEMANAEDIHRRHAAAVAPRLEHEIQSAVAELARVQAKLPA